MIIFDEEHSNKLVLQVKTLGILLAIISILRLIALFLPIVISFLIARAVQSDLIRDFFVILKQCLSQYSIILEDKYGAFGLYVLIFIITIRLLGFFGGILLIRCKSSGKHLALLSVAAQLSFNFFELTNLFINKAMFFSLNGSLTILFNIVLLYLLTHNRYESVLR